MSGHRNSLHPSPNHAKLFNSASTTAHLHLLSYLTTMSQPRPQPPLLPDDIVGMNLHQYVASIALRIQDPVMQNQLDFRDLAANGVAAWVRAEVDVRQMLQGDPRVILVSVPIYCATHTLARDADDPLRRPWPQGPTLIASGALRACTFSRGAAFKTKIFPTA